MIAVVIVLVVVIVILAAIFAMAPLGSHATLTINVYSTHISATISWNVYIDNSLIKSGTSLDPGYYAYFTYTYGWDSSGDTSIVVSATSSGGYLGSFSDSRTLTVTDGGAYTVNLYV